MFSYLQVEVDENPAPGRFVLAGSQHFGLTEAIGQSLAGRIGLLHLLPPSFDELARFGELPSDVWRLVWTGAYPRIYDRKLDPGQWLSDYTATYIQRDVRRVLNVTNLDGFTTFLRLMAGRTACELNLSALGSDAGITHNTARTWVSVLEASFLCLRLTGWHRNARKQMVKAPKMHFVDTGLACHLLGIGGPDQLRHHPLRGALFESWVVAEVFKSRLHRGLPANLFHYRDSKRLEVDLLLEEGGRLTAVEVKPGATVASDFFGALGKFGVWVGQQPAVTEYVARVVYGGDGLQRRGDIEVVPWRELQGRRW